MSDTLDNRILKIGFAINGKQKVYEGLEISAKGTLFANPLQDECTVKIANLDETTRNYILSLGGPFVNPEIDRRIFVYAGRESYGQFVLFEGSITTVVPSMPPDITLTIKAMTGDHVKRKNVTRAYGKTANLSTVAQGVADDLGVSLNFQAPDMTLGNYAHAGAALRQVERLGQAGNVDAFLSGNTLYVKGRGVPLSGQTRVLNIDTGMVSLPEITERGLRVTFLLDNVTKIGGGLQLKSIRNPAANGDYVIYKLEFDVASRQKPFYYIAEAIRR